MQRHFSVRKIVFAIYDVETTGHPYCRKMNFNVTPFIKTNSKWVIELNVKPETLKIEGNMGENLCDLGLDKVLGYNTQSINWTLSKFKTFA